MRILVIKTKFIGDTVLASAFFQALKLQYPTSIVTALLSPLTAQILANNPYIDHVLITSALDSHASISKWQRFKVSFTLLSQLKAGQYQQAYVLTRSFYSALIIYFANIPQRNGLASDGRSLLLTSATPDTRDTPEYRAYLKLLSVDGSSLPSAYEHIKPQYFVTSAESQAAMLDINLQYASNQTQKECKKIIFLHLSGTNSLRRWKNESWVLLAKYLIANGFYILWSGASGDMKHMQQILSQLSPTELSASYTLPVLRGGELLPVRQLAALISQCAASICVDTGPMHVSAALQIPTIGLFGPGDTIQWQPIGYSKNHSKPHQVGNTPPNDHLYIHGQQNDFLYQAVISEDILPCRPCHGRAGCSLIQADSQLPQCMDGLSVKTVIQSFERLPL